MAKSYNGQCGYYREIRLLLKFLRIKLDISIAIKLKSVHFQAIEASLVKKVVYSSLKRLSVLETAIPVKPASRINEATFALSPSSLLTCLPSCLSL